MTTPTPADAAIPAHLPIAQADPKPWWRSRTILAALAIVTAQALALLGISVDAGQLTEILLAAGTAIAGLIAIWGRARAEQPIAPLRRRVPVRRTDGAPPHDFDDD
jgi:peptidoglycan/LPS O-acetylase OafA/YrhL